MSSIIKVDQIQLSNGAAPSANDLGITGSVINTWHFSNNERSTMSGSTNTWYNVPNFALSVTPTRADSKLLVMIHICWATGVVNSPGYSGYVRCLRNGAVDKQLNGNGKDTDGTGGDSTVGYSCFGQYRQSAGDHGNYHMDKSTLIAYITPGTTDTQTFQVQWRSQNNPTFHMNSDTSYGEQPSGSHQPNGISTITVQEII